MSIVGSRYPAIIPGNLTAAATWSGADTPSNAPGKYCIRDCQLHLSTEHSLLAAVRDHPPPQQHIPHDDLPVADRQTRYKTTERSCIILGVASDEQPD